MVRTSKNQLKILDYRNKCERHPPAESLEQERRFHRTMEFTIRTGNEKISLPRNKGSSGSTPSCHGMWNNKHDEPYNFRIPNH
jgi:hypothetical protein